MLQILGRYLTKEGRVRKFYIVYMDKNLAFLNLKGSHVRNFLGLNWLAYLYGRVGS